MKLARARELLFSRAAPSELWVRHSLVVCRVARTIGARLPRYLDLDRELLASAALLHDIGRCRTHGVWHPWEGWRLLREVAGVEVARPALTHWRKGRRLRRFLATAPDLDRARVLEIYRLVPPRPQTLVDLAVSVADGMVAHDRVVPMARRYQDLRERYGHSPWLVDSQRISRGQLGRLSRLAGLDLEGAILLESAS